MKYEIANLIVEYEPTYDRLAERSKKYITNSDKECDFSLKLYEGEVEGYLEVYTNADEARAEYMILGTRFYKNLLKFNGCMLHASCVVVDDEAYLFSADSGTGKSTHTGLWLEHLKDKNPYILNDDKPALRVIDGSVYAYGTPFSGKHDINENRKVKVKGICFITRAEEKNEIQRLSNMDAMALFYRQSVKRLSEVQVNRFLNVLECVIDTVPIYGLKCDMSREAVMLSYTTMKEGLKDES